MDIAIIPARGNSKRIPKKNIKEFCGKPIIYYSIKAAFESGQFDEIIVSTENEEIRDIALSYGAKVPFLRPVDLSDDFTPIVPVIKHVINEYENLGQSLNYVSCIFATAPFIEITNLKKAKDISKSYSGIYCFPVSEYFSPIQRSLILNESNQVTSMFPENQNIRTQDFNKTYFDAGQFYFAHKNTWIKNSNIHQFGRVIIIPKWSAVDIDDFEDWSKAEKYYSSLFR